MDNTLVVDDLDRAYVSFAKEYAEHKGLHQAKQLFTLSEAHWELISQLIGCESSIVMLSEICKRTTCEDVKKKASSYMDLCARAHIGLHTYALDTPNISKEEAEGTLRLIENVRTIVFEDISAEQILDFINKHKEQA